MKLQPIQRFLEEDDGGGGTGGAATLFDNIRQMDDEGNVDPPTPPEDDEEEVEEVVETPEDKVDTAELVRQFGGIVTKAMAKRDEPSPQPMTEAERKKLLNDFDIDDTFMAEFDNLETRKASLEKYKQNLVKYMDTIVQVRMRKQQADMEAAHAERYAPILNAHEERQIEERYVRFGKVYPQLSATELRPVIAAVAAQFKQEFKSEKEFFSAVANRVAAGAKTTNPNFKLVVAKAKAKSSNALPPTTSGAGGGGGTGNGTAKAGGPTGIGLFAKVTPR